MKKERKKLNYNWGLINDQVPAVFLLLIWLFLEICQKGIFPLKIFHFLVAEGKSSAEFLDEIIMVALKRNEIN